MHFPILALAAAGGLASAADYIRCGTESISDALMVELNAAAENTAFSIAATRNVETYVHVVTTQAKAGRYTQQMVDEQMQVMNESYAPIGVSFTTISSEFTVNDAWAAASSGSDAEKQMKQALRQGSYGDLNLYFLSDLGGGLLGFCYFPVSNPSADDLVLDGCINLAASMPGAEATNYDMGLTAVHETGHWFGLYHVFQYTIPCLDQGDYVADTPAQRTATRGCPAAQDSCPLQKGVDSIHNYMDYSYDACMYEFTPGQASRATTLFDQYRAGK